MSVNAAGSAQNVQQAMNALRQTVQAEQVAASTLSEAATEAAKQAVTQDPGPKTEGVGENVDIKA